MDRGRPSAADLHPGHGGAVTERHSVLGSGEGHGSRNGVHAAHREVHAGHRVHVGDHGVQRESVLRGQARVHRLEREHPAGSLVVQIAAHHGLEAAKGTEGNQPGQGRP